MHIIEYRNQTKLLRQSSRRFTLLDADPVLGDLLPDVEVQPVHEPEGQEDAGH